MAVSVAFLVGAHACLSGTQPTPVCGTFDARLTGVVDDSVSGCAYFSVKAAGDFGMVLTGGSASDANPAVKLIRGSAPGIGTYPLGQVIGDFCGGPQVLCGVAVFGGQTYTLAGTVVVTQSDTLNVAGTIVVTGTSTSGDTLNISGSFAAACQAQSTVASGGEQPGDARRPTTCKPGTGAG